MKALDAAYFDGRSSRRWPARLSCESGQVVVLGEFGERRYPLADLEVGEAMGAVERQLAFPDGSRCTVADLPALAAWLAEAGVRDSAVVRLQQRWIWALGALAAVVAAVALGYYQLLPWAAEKIAPRVPGALVTALSSQVLDALDGRVLKPTKLPEATQARLQQRLDAILQGSGQPGYRLYFRASRMGPNAFALPDGHVVVFDDLVKLAASDEEVLGVVAHELGHVAHRHGLRLLIQSSVVSFVVGMYLGDLSSVAAGAGVALLESRYSREFEREADDYAARTLVAAGLGTEPLAAMLERIAKLHKEMPGAAGLGDLFSSHPDTAERVARLRALQRPGP